MESSQLPGITSDTVSNVANSGVTVNTVSNIASTPATQDSSIFSMFWNAGFVIKIVILTLLAASIWSWAIIIGKHFSLKRLSRDADYFEDSFWSGSPLDSLYKEMKDSMFDPMSNIFCAAMAEWQSFSHKNSQSGSESTKTLERRVDRVMQVAIRKEIDELEKHMGFLSSLGTNGVILGLFGTVLGILNGFKVLALQQGTSLAVVAPVISEALFTTALGIIAAIPAAVGYNKFMNDINRYVNRLETFADEFSSIISRQFDER